MVAKSRLVLRPWMRSTNSVKSTTAPRKQGGVLLGRLIVNTEDVVVDEITKPGPDDIRGRYRFKRSSNSAQPRVVSAWRESTGTKIYLGDWHSHPEDHPSPSSVDRRDWNRVVKRAVYEQDFLLFAIVGRRSIGVWEGRRIGRRSTALHQCPAAIDDPLTGAFPARPTVQDKRFRLTLGVGERRDSLPRMSATVTFILGLWGRENPSHGRLPADLKFDEGFLWNLANEQRP